MKDVGKKACSHDAMGQKRSNKLKPISLPAVSYYSLKRFMMLMVKMFSKKVY